MIFLVKNTALPGAVSVYKTIQEAELHVNRLLQMWEYPRYKTWIETSNGEKVPPITDERKQQVLRWLRSGKSTYFCLAVHEPLPPVAFIEGAEIPDAMPIQRLEFKRELWKDNSDKPFYKAIDQYGRAVSP